MIRETGAVDDGLARPAPGSRAHHEAEAGAGQWEVMYAQRSSRLRTPKL
jgi:hypothetical protein